MALALDFKYGSYRYSDQNVLVSDYSISQPVRNRVMAVPRSNKARQVAGYLSPRVINLQGEIGYAEGATPTASTLRDAISAFRTAHGVGIKNFYDASDGGTFDRYIQAEVQDIPQIDYPKVITLPAIFTVSMIAGDPYWYASTASLSLWASPVTAGTKVVANSGGETTPPTFTITSNATSAWNLTLTNTTTGESFTLNSGATAVTSGTQVVVDCSAQTVQWNGSNRMSWFSGSFYDLATGSNTITLTLTSGTLTSIQVGWRHRWL